MGMTAAGLPLIFGDGQLSAVPATIVPRSNGQGPAPESLLASGVEQAPWASPIRRRTQARRRFLRHQPSKPSFEEQLR